MNRWQVTKVLFAIVAVWLVPSSAGAAGFNCRFASTAVEKMICDEPELSRMDETMVDLYKAQIANASNRDEVTAQQYKWRTEVRDKCTSAYCLVLAYRNRLGILGLRSSEPHGPPSQLSAPGQPFIPVFTTSVVRGAPNPIVSGTTNLPDGALLQITLQGLPPECIPRCIYLTSSATVVGGKFTSESFGNLEPGAYRLFVGTGFASGQPKRVQDVIGQHSENVVGPTLHRLPGVSEPFIEYETRAVLR
jgi:hypothetical protein